MAPTSLTMDAALGEGAHYVGATLDLDVQLLQRVRRVDLHPSYSASLTEGRGFDYEMLRRYGLKNEQEGVQLRTFGNGRYLITYAFEDPPQVKTGRIKHHIFARLRVTIVEK